jgi:copper oxidase (laccase) domain-containing protein
MLYILHSGFAGTCLNIVFSAQKDFVSRCAEPSLTGCKTWAWIGPGICTECYSRNKDDLKTLEAEKTFAMGNYYEENDIIHFDLKNEIKKQLIASHVPEEHILCQSNVRARNIVNYIHTELETKTKDYFSLHMQNAKKYKHLVRILQK